MNSAAMDISLGNVYIFLMGVELKVVLAIGCTTWSARVDTTKQFCYVVESLLTLGTVLFFVVCLF